MGGGHASGTVAWLIRLISVDMRACMQIETCTSAILSLTDREAVLSLVIFNDQLIIITLIKDTPKISSETN